MDMECSTAVMNVSGRNDLPESKMWYVRWDGEKNESINEIWYGHDSSVEWLKCSTRDFGDLDMTWKLLC